MSDRKPASPGYLQTGMLLFRESQDWLRFYQTVPPSMPEAQGKALGRYFRAALAAETMLNLARKEIS
jgi:hypothetical protein